MPHRTLSVTGVVLLAGLALGACKDNGTVESQPGANPVQETVTQSTQSSATDPAQPAR